MPEDAQPDPVDHRRPATDAEARALASEVRLRILRICLDEPHTNVQIARQLGRNPASVLHHVRTLVAAGFLQALPVQQGERGSRPRPYQATRKSWQLSTSGDVVSGPMIDAFLAAVSRIAPQDLNISRLGLRLDEAGRKEFSDRLQGLLDEFAARPAPVDASPWSAFIAVHPDPDRSAAQDPE